MPFILSEGNISNICVLSQCIVYWIHLQNIHTFTYQKTLVHKLLLLVFKNVESLHCILKWLSFLLSPSFWKLEISLFCITHCYFFYSGPVKIDNEVVFFENLSENEINFSLQLLDKKVVIKNDSYYRTSLTEKVICIFDIYNFFMLHPTDGKVIFNQRILRKTYWL